MRKKEKQMKEKEEKKIFPIDDYLFVNAHHSWHNNLIREERENKEKENNETMKNLKYQVAKNLETQSCTIAKLEKQWWSWNYRN